jgi:hypothetical protein
MTTLAIGSNVPEGAACGASATAPATASKPTMIDENRDIS